jgi:hypothetical protein
MSPRPRPRHRASTSPAGASAEPSSVNASGCSRSDCEALYRRHAIVELANALEDLSWESGGFLEFEAPIALPDAAEHFSRWIATLEATGSLYSGLPLVWVRGAEPDGHAVREFHVLIGNHAGLSYFAMRSEWERIAGGHAHLVGHDPRHQRAADIAKSAAVAFSSSWFKRPAPVQPHRRRR